MAATAVAVVSAAWRETLRAGAPWPCVHGGVTSTRPHLPALRDLLAWHGCHPSTAVADGVARLFASTTGTVRWLCTADPALGTRLALDVDACDELYGHMAGHSRWLAAREVVDRRDVPATTLDDWTAGNDLRDILLLSLALEGGELDALRGADGLLREGGVSIVRTAVVLRPLYRDQPTYTDVDGWLVARGYRLVDCRWPWDAPGRVDRRQAGGQPARRSIEGIATYAHGTLLEGDSPPLPRAIAAAAILAQCGYGSTAATILDRHPMWDRGDTDAWLNAYARPGRRERWAAWLRSRWPARR
jgi:hypothetical protein